MSSVMVLLQIDHINTAKLLDLIEQLARKMTILAPVNLNLLESSLAYLLNYPDQCHHPREDLVYRRLLSKSPDMARSLNDLVKEHEQLAFLTRDLMRVVGESRQNLYVGNDRLAGQLIEFVNFYRHHMMMEEQYFFPIALQRLSRDDFVEIDFTLFDQPDPLVAQESEERFAELREEIARLDVVDKANRESRDEAALLAVIQDIAAFNVAMERIGSVVRLAGSTKEGYKLEHKGNVLVHIPACNESLAAWCAYFYWKAWALRNAKL